MNAKELTVTDCNHNFLSKIQKKYLNTDLYGSLIRVSNFYKIIKSISEKGGKSCAFVFITTDEKLVIKTVTKHEYTIFKEQLLENYVNHELNFENSRIMRIFAVLYLNELDQYIAIMENLLYKREENFIFDLKGSKVGRNVKEIENPLRPPKGIVLKDINFTQFGYKIQLETEKKEKIIQELFRDFNLLKNSGIMDYSILLGIRESKVNKEASRVSFVDLGGFVVSLGVIDIFQEYNMKKIGESAIKSIFNNPQEVSSIDPDQYFNRICEFTTAIFQ